MFVVTILSAVLPLAWAAGPPDGATLRDEKQLQGTWRVVSAEGFAPAIPKEELNTLALTFRGDTIHARYADKFAEGTYRLDATRTPRAIDVTVTQGPEQVKGKTLKGIYLLEGNTLKIGYRGPGKDRPAEFVAEGQPPLRKLFLKRGKP